MPVIVSILPAQYADVAFAGLHCLDAVLSPMAASRKSQQVSTAMRVGAIFFPTCPERSGEVPVYASLRCKAWPPLMQLFRNPIDGGFEYNAAVQMQGRINQAYVAEGATYVRICVNGQPGCPRGEEQ